MEAAAAFGLAFEVDAAAAKRSSAWGADVMTTSGDVLRGLPVPAVYVMDENGLITYRYANPNFRERADPEEILAAARAVAAVTP